MLGNRNNMWNLFQSFLSWCRCILKEDIVKVSSFTAISTLVKMLTGLISIKVVASIIGPAGVALVGQLNNFASIAMTFSSGGINSGITKYIAEYKEDKNLVCAFLTAALYITVVCSLCIGVLMISFHHYLSEYIMLSSEYGYVFIIFGMTILLYAFNMMLISIINGFKEFKCYVRISIANSIVGLFFTLSFVLTLGLKGALISAVTYQSIMLLITIWMIRKLPWFNWNTFTVKFSRNISKKYLQFTAMALATASALPISQMLLRGYVISEISPVEAGWWEAMNRLSNMYLMVLTTSFSVYYFPRLSELIDRAAIRQEIFKTISFLIPLLLIGFCLLYFLRYTVIYILFTPEFYPMESLFVWQLLGDFFKICSWTLSMLMVAKSMTKIFVTTEVLFGLSFVLLGFIFTRFSGSVLGLVQGYFVNCFAYFIFMLYTFRKLLIFKS